MLPVIGRILCLSESRCERSLTIAITILVGTVNVKVRKLRTAWLEKMTRWSSFMIFATMLRSATALLASSKNRISSLFMKVAASHAISGVTKDWVSAVGMKKFKFLSTASTCHFIIVTHWLPLVILGNLCCPLYFTWMAPHFEARSEARPDTAAYLRFCLANCDITACTPNLHNISHRIWPIWINSNPYNKATPSICVCEGSPPKLLDVAQREIPHLKARKTELSMGYFKFNYYPGILLETQVKS